MGIFFVRLGVYWRFSFFGFRRFLVFFSFRRRAERGVEINFKFIVKIFYSDYSLKMKMGVYFWDFVGSFGDLFDYFSLSYGFL